MQHLLRLRSAGPFSCPTTFERISQQTFVHIMFHMKFRIRDHDATVRVKEAEKSVVSIEPAQMIRNTEGSVITHINKTSDSYRAGLYLPLALCHP